MEEMNNNMMLKKQKLGLCLLNKKELRPSSKAGVRLEKIPENTLPKLN